MSVCEHTNSSPGFNFCCDNGRTPTTCCKNSSELIHSDAPFSSITAGPASQTPGVALQLGAPVAATTSPTQEIIGTFALASQTSQVTPDSSTSSVSNQTASTNFAPQAHPHHSALDAGLGSGLGGAFAITLTAFILVYLRRRKRRKQTEHDSKDEPHELPTADPSLRPNSMLFPAELNHETRRNH